MPVYVNNMYQSMLQSLMGGYTSGVNQQMQQQQWNGTSQYLTGIPYPQATPKLEIGEQPKLKEEKLCFCSRHLWSRN